MGCLSIDRGMRDFIEFSIQIDLIDIPMCGRKYTWSNHQDRAILSRLDRFLLSQLWLDNYKVVQQGIHWLVFDHCPIVLFDDGRD